MTERPTRPKSPAPGRGPAHPRRAWLAGAASALGLAGAWQAAARAATQAATAPDGGRRPTGLVADPRFALRAFGSKHPEQPARVAAVNAQLAAGLPSGSFAHLKPHEQVEDAIRLVHTEAHVDGIRERYDDEVNAVARAAVGATTAAVEAVANGRVANAFVASRPPGHHARNTGREEGFCFFNHVAIGARVAQQRFGRRRILIVDWDYHHGDGTEHLFYDDPDVMYFSTHDGDAYPRSSDPSRTGGGAAAGTKFAVPLPCGATDAQVLSVYRERLLPAADRFRPDFVLVSAGFDSRVDDLLGCFAITDAGYAQMTALVAAIAKRHCEGRLVSVLEGGYNLAGLASGAAAHVKALIDAAR